MTTPFSVIGAHFIAQDALDVIIEKYPTCTVITDSNHKIILKVKQHNTRIRYQRVLLDADDEPIAMLRKKKFTMHCRWNVYRGESKSDSDLIFSTKNQHAIRCINKYIRVILGNKKSSGDLRIKGSLSKGNCAIYMGASSTAVAQMHKPITSKYAKGKFRVTIQPNMDYAFVVALLAIVDAMENPDEMAGYGKAANVAGCVLANVAGCVLDVIGALATN